MEGMVLLLTVGIMGTSIALIIALAKRARGVAEAARDWWPPARWARRRAEAAAYEQWRRQYGGAWLDSWWNTPEPAPGQARDAAAPPREIPGRMSAEEARRKLAALLELTVARGATPAEAATARAIAERLKAEYDLG